MCIFVCKVPAGSPCLSFLSVCISVLDSTWGLTFTHPILMKNSTTIIARNKRNCCLKQSSIEHSGAFVVMSHWCSIGLMAPMIMYLVENVDDCAHTKRQVTPTNVSEWVCTNECARVLTYLSFITFERSPLARGRHSNSLEYFYDTLIVIIYWQTSTWVTVNVLKNEILSRLTDTWSSWCLYNIYVYIYTVYVELVLIWRK